MSAADAGAADRAATARERSSIRRIAATIPIPVRRGEGVSATNGERCPNRLREVAVPGASYPPHISPERLTSTPRCRLDGTTPLKGALMISFRTAALTSAAVAVLVPAAAQAKTKEMYA